MNKDLMEKLEAAADAHDFAVKFNLKQLFGGLFYSLKLEAEKEGFVGDLDTLIDVVVNTSKYSGPEFEEYPVYDEKATTEIVKRWAKMLEAHGVQTAWGKNL